MKPIFSFFLLITLPFYLQSSVTSERKIIEALTSIGPRGSGNEKAALIMPLIKGLNSSSILPLLHAMNQANSLGDNWIRASISEIIDQSKMSFFPQTAILAFANNQKNIGSSRRTAFELLREHDPELAHSIVPGFINDPEPSLRREAVAQLLEKAKSSKNEKDSRLLYEKILSYGRDVSQIKEASSALNEMGESIDLIELMGFLVNWELIGPFDNSERSGFEMIFPPEKTQKVQSFYKGKNGDIRWNSFSSKDPLGMVNINELYGEIKEVLAYAKTSFNSSSSRLAQFRIGSKNAWKIWLNGDLLFARDEYHRGSTRVDQFIVEGELKKGENIVLLKVCQNEQTQSWTKQWEFCLRITDPEGSPIRSDSN